MEIEKKKVFKISNLIHGEIFFALFVVAGAYKETIRFQSYIDLTLLFMIISFIIAIRKLIMTRKIPKGAEEAIIPFVVLCVIMLNSLFFTKSNIYSHQKIMQFVIINGWSYIGAVLLIRSDKQLIRFLLTISSIGIIMSLDGVKIFLSGGTAEFINPLSTNYLTFARLTSISAITILCYYSLRLTRFIPKIISIAIFVLLVFSTVISGARGPILVLTFCIFILPFFNMNTKGKNIKKGFLKKAFLIIIIMIFTLFKLYNLGYLDTFINRMIYFKYNTDAYGSRNMLAKVGYLMWKEKPILGWGIGSFPIYAFGIDFKEYPHNIFLELLCEMGIIGLIPFLCMYILSIYRAIRCFKLNTNIKSKYIQLTFVIDLFFLLSLTFFSCLIEARLMFTFMALAIVSPWRNKAHERE